MRDPRYQRSYSCPRITRSQVCYKPSDDPWRQGPRAASGINSNKSAGWQSNTWQIFSKASNRSPFILPDFNRLRLASVRPIRVTRSFDKSCAPYHVEPWLYCLILSASLRKVVPDQHSFLISHQRRLKTPYYNASELSPGAGKMRRIVWRTRSCL